MSERPRIEWSTNLTRWGAAAAALVLTACTSIAGLDNTYELDDPETGGQGGSGGSAQPGSGGGGGAGGAGGAGGGTAGGGGSDGLENCFDGVDNDNDGLTDCEDLASCAAIVECVPVLPNGFTKYVRYVAQPHTGMPLTAPPCPDGSQPEAFFAGPAGAPTCGACSCAWPGAACSAPTIQCFKETTICASGADATITASNEACLSMANFSGPTGSESCQLTGPATVSNKGSCSTSGGAMTPEPMWQEEMFVCALGPTGGGCAAGQVCAPRPSADYMGALCVEADGDVACPSGWTTEQRTAYTGGTDARVCSGCACMSDVSCANDGSYTAYDENNCTGPSALVSTSCTDVSAHLGTTGSLKPKVASVVNGQCGGGDPMGAVVGTGPITLCCQ